MDIHIPLRPPLSAGDRFGPFLQLLLQPGAFFAGFARRRSATAALLFAAGCLLVATSVAGLFMRAGLDRIEGGAAALLFLAGLTLDQELAGTRVSTGGLIGAAVLAPLFGALLLAVVATTVHLLTIAVAGDQHAGFGASLRAVAYASMINLANWLPLVGLPLNIYGAYLVMVGVRELHGVSTRRAALIAFAPVAAVLLFFLLLRILPE